MTTAAWQKAYRERRKAGRIVIEVEFDEARLVAVLEKARLLSPMKADDRDAIENAAQEWINEMFKD